ncbi:MAG: carbohydrate kinase family protein [Armatimonadota bacterium]
MMTSLSLSPGQMRYQAMIGVGGIGSGMFFALSGNHTLGREESRGGHFLDRRDYCKLHIISHYVQTLLGPAFTTIPVGRVGADDAGARLLEEMAEVGLDLRYTHALPGEQTLFSFCFIYPDGSGGNLTTDDSACARVDAAAVQEAEAEFTRFAGRGVALAAPEAPLDARIALLELATRYHFFRVASFTSEEIAGAVVDGLLAKVDLLAINIDEAGLAAGINADGRPPAEVVAAAVDVLAKMNPALQISITAGKDGSWAWDGSALTHQPVFPVTVESTAGAGDAHLSGVIAGLAAGLPLAQAHQLGALTGSVSVTSLHTINKEIDRELLGRYVRESGITLDEAVRELFV